MLQPKRTKYRKQHKGRIHGEAKGGSDLTFGPYGLKATEPERVTARQIEAARRAMTRHMKRQGRVWIRIFPDVPVTSKPTEVRMGKGKGSVDYWAAKVKPGRIMFETRRRGRRRRPRGPAPGRDEAADQDEGRRPRGLVSRPRNEFGKGGGFPAFSLFMAAKRHEATGGKYAPWPGRSASAFGSWSVHEGLSPRQVGARGGFLFAAAPRPRGSPSRGPRSSAPWPRP